MLNNIERTLDFLSNFAKEDIVLKFNKQTKRYKAPKFVYIGPSFFTLSNFSEDFIVNGRTVSHFINKVSVFGLRRKKSGYLVKLVNRSMLGSLNREYSLDVLVKDMSVVKQYLDFAEKNNIETWLCDIVEILKVVLDSGEIPKHKIPVGINLKRVN